MEIWTYNGTFKEGRFEHLRRKKVNRFNIKRLEDTTYPVIHNNQSIDKALDGQQRLAAIFL